MNERNKVQSVAVGIYNWVFAWLSAINGPILRVDHRHIYIHSSYKGIFGRENNQIYGHIGTL
jgi:hypothetical protein